MHPNLSRDHYFALGINPSATAAEIILAAEHQTIKTEDACHALLQIRNHQEQISAKGPEFNHQNILSSALAILNVIAKDDTISSKRIRPPPATLGAEKSLTSTSRDTQSDRSLAI